ncbi:unnamed protein product [Tilletia controversa]|nr:unnamed protein product [Tilletia controversa]
MSAVFASTQAHWQSAEAVLGSALRPLSAALVVSMLVFVLFKTNKSFRTAITFAWNCFLQPIGKVANQAQRLDRFYENQAHVYDSTRTGLLRGRKSMLKLCAAQLREMQRTNPGKPLVWVDLGGGTGWNIEMMGKYFPLEELSAIYLIDLCEPLLKVARERFNHMGLTNVQVLCQDAQEFSLPGLDDGRKVDLFTCSYSISMMPPFYAILDRINEFLDPDTGIFGVVDFYVSAASTPREKAPAVGGDTSRHCGWLSRLFWSQWFSLDHIELHPARRDYLEYKFGTIKCYNGRNNFIIPFIVRIPYYIWIGCSRQRDVSPAVQAFEVEAGNRVVCPPSFPEISFAHMLQDSKSSDNGTSSSHSVRSVDSTGLRRRGSDGVWSDTGSEKAFRLDHVASFPKSSFHYQQRQWRLPFVDNQFSDMFRTWIYGFTWEDPHIDIEHINLGPEDSILCITSAGDNALHYAAAVQPKRIHAVDMNPCQGHLLELKLASIVALEYEDFWRMFGDGKCENFRELLDSKISPYLSSHAYQFWRLNTSSFDKCFYFRGYSGHALRLAKFAFNIAGVRKDVERMCKADTVEEQQKIWDTRLRGTLINKHIIRFFLSNPAFLWNALGVPINQMNVFLNEGCSVEQFAIDTLDSIPSRNLIKNNNYHYQLCLQHKYTKDSCPLYLKKEAFQKLKKDAAQALESFRLHTDSIVNVLRGLPDGGLSHAIVMDHLDWYDPIDGIVPVPDLKAARKDADKSISDLDREIVEMHRVIKTGGVVFYRSAGKRPWYNQRFEKAGFKVEAVHIRETGQPTDNVNMYASFYRATKI